MDFCGGAYGEIPVLKFDLKVKPNNFGGKNDEVQSTMTVFIFDTKGNRNKVVFHNLMLRLFKIQ